jgi:hypothetical protein
LLSFFLKAQRGSVKALDAFAMEKQAAPLPGRPACQIRIAGA